MGKVVFSEGVNDLIFLGRLHNEYCSNLSFDTFNNEVAETNETKRLTQHEVDNLEFLYKSEGGKQKVCQILSDVSLQSRGLNIDLFVMVDLDNDPVENLYDEIDRCLTIDYGNKVNIIENNRSFNNDFCVLSCEFEVNVGQNIPVVIFAFHESLERVTGIVDGESKISKRHKADKYISNCPGLVKDMAEELY